MRTLPYIYIVITHMISPEQEKHFYTLLLESQQDLETKIKSLETPPDFGDYPGPDDNTDESEESFNRSASARALREQLANVQHALSKFEKKTYGICEATGKEIPVEILDINPEARFHPDYIKQQHGDGPSL